MIGPFFLPFGLKTTGSSIMGIIVVLSGALVCPFVGMFLDKTQKYMFTFRFICFGVFIAQAVGALYISDQNWTCGVYSATLGILMIPIVPTTFALVCELTHPLSPAAVIGVLTTIANFADFGIVLFYNYLLSDGTVRGSKNLIWFWSG